MRLCASLTILFFVISDVRVSCARMATRAKFSTQTTKSTLEIVQDAPAYNTSQTLLNLVVESIYDFNANFRQWINNKALFNYDKRVATNESMDIDDHTVSFSEIDVQTGGVSTDVSQLYCKFPDRLTIHLPFDGDSLKFSGVIYVTDGINYSIKGSYEILLKHLNLTLFTKLNTNQSEFQLNYMGPQITLVINSNVRQVAHVAIGQLVDMLKLYLKSSITEKITAVTRKNAQFARLLANCRRSGSQSLEESDRNYGINQNSIQLNDQVTLNTKFITVRGLKNFNFIVIKFSDIYSPNSYNRFTKVNHTVSFRIDNLKGDLYWKLQDSYGKPLSKYAPWEFTIDHILIVASFSNDRLNLIDVNIVSLDTVTESNDNFSLLGRTILEGKLSKMIASSLKASLLQAYNDVYRDVYF